MRAPQTKRDVPKTGARTRLPDDLERHEGRAGEEHGRVEAQEVAGAIHAASRAGADAFATADPRWNTGGRGYRIRKGDLR